MGINRRQFLKGLGSVSVVILGGGVYRAVDQGVFAAGTGPAYELWEDWKTEPAEGPLRLVQAGILAANPHNTQPWLFQVTNNRIEMYADLSRTLRTMDVYKREMYIGLGCALENMLLTAAAVGYQTKLTLDEGELTHFLTSSGSERVAVIDLAPGTAQPADLFTAIPIRRTNRYSYDTTKSVPQASLEQLVALAANQADVQIQVFQKGTAAYDTLAATTISATEMIIADHEMAHDSYVWIDQSWEEVQTSKDGPYIDTAGTPALTRALVKLLPSTSQKQIDDGWLANTKATMVDSDALGFISVQDLYTKTGALNAGRIWQRMHLWATTQSLAMQPINQIPEVIDRDREQKREPKLAQTVASITGTDSWKPTFAFRIGYPLNEVLPSARRPVEDVLI